MLTSISNVCLVCGRGASQLFAIPALASLPRGVASFEHGLAQCALFQLPAVVKL